MDQVRTILNVIWTQRFWVLSVLCAIVGGICWNSASGSINIEFNKRKQAIESAYSSVNNIKNERNHPNDDVNDGNMKQAKLQRDFVKKEWQQLYERQQTEVCTWPKGLGAGFIADTKGLEFGDKIGFENRMFYLDFIKLRFEGLLEIVDAKKIAYDKNASNRGGGGGRYGGGEGGREGGAGYSAPGRGSDDDLEEEGYLVTWPQQGKLRSKLDFQSRPSDMKVWVTQENLWVYETLLGIIAKTNEERGATRPDNTAVRTIQSIKVGKTAGGPSPGKITLPSPKDSGDGGGGGGYGRGGGEFDMSNYGRGGGEAYSRGGGDGGGEFDMSNYGRGGGEGMGRGEGSDGGGSSLVAYRYLNDEGKPAEGGDGNYGTAEFRKLPIQMTLEMDQRWIPQFLIQCANATLPVEVKQVRINSNKSGIISGRTSGGNRRISKSSNPNMAIVEIYGTVYIYNKPDAEQLSLPGDSELSDENDSDNIDENDESA